jgi:hypothetical protein
MGEVQGDIYGDLVTANPGQDEITNSGSVAGDIFGDFVHNFEFPAPIPTGAGDDDTITNSGEVGGSIFAEGGDDTVILQNGANGGDDNILPIDGGDGVDILRFEFSVPDDAAFNALTAEIESKNPASDSIVIDGETYTWTNFEGVVADLTNLTPSEITVNITENELHDAMQNEIASNPDIVDLEFVLPDFVPDAINMTIRTTNGVVASLTVTITDDNGVAVIQLGTPMVAGVAAPADVIASVNRELPQIITAALDERIYRRAYTTDFVVQAVSVTNQYVIFDILR